MATLRYSKGNTIIRFNSFKITIYDNTTFVTPKDIQELPFQDLRLRIALNSEITVAETFC